MARAKASEPRKAKPSVAEELTHGIAKLRELSTQIDDLSRDGFPYREAGRARTELSFRETIRRLFGEKSPEYQTHKNHKLRVGSRAEAAQSTALVKQLIAALENQKTDLVGLKSASPVAPPVTTTERPTLTAVPLDSPSDSLTTPSTPSTAPITAVTMTSAPMTVSVAMTTNLITPAQANAPVIMTTPVSVGPVPILTAPAASPQPVREASMPRQLHPSSSPQPDTTQTVPASVSVDEVTPSLAIPVPSPTTPAPPTPASTIDLPSSLEPRSTALAAISTSASLRTMIPQGTIPPVPQTIQPPASTPASQTEPPLPLRRVSEPADALGSIPSSVTPSTATPIEATADTVIGTPPNDKPSAVPNVEIEVLSTQPPSAPVPKPTQSMAQATVFLAAPPALEASQKGSTESGQAETGTLDMLRRICARFHLVARQLQLRKEYRPTIEITDEYDLQDLLYALLRLQFDEVGTEEWTPDYANGARRTSYLLDWDRTVVVVKQTRSGLTTKDLAEQVKSDAAHYSARPNGTTLLCFIYDPEGRVGNPRGLEADLTTVSDTYMVEVIVAPK
ncbi:MAG: hypothetical protein HY348_16305 [Nitrospira defluvii]|nr:hypothetical protein [Nitrospira defluvii]